MKNFLLANVLLLVLSISSCSKNNDVDNCLVAPGAPNIIFPNSYSHPQFEHSNIYFKWNSELNATSYHLQISNCNFCTNFQIDTIVTDTTFSSRWNDLGGNTSYNWRVKALNECNISSDYASSSFSVVQSPWEHGYAYGRFNVLINGNFSIPGANFDTTFHDLNVTINGWAVDFIPNILPNERYLYFETPPFFNFALSKISPELFYTGGNSNGVIVTGDLIVIPQGFIIGEIYFSGIASGQVTVETVP